MKRFSYYMSCVLFAALPMLSCTPEDTDGEQTVPVEQVVLDESIASGKTMVVGEEFNISELVTVLPENATDKTVTYGSSSESVATVSPEGVISALAAGSTEITVSSGEKEASFELTVETAEVPVEQVVLDESIASGKTMAVGEEFNISELVTVLPENATDKTVTYVSSSESVATVSPEGVISALAAGSTEITVSSGEKEASFELTVNAPVLITSISFSEQLIDEELTEENTTINLTELLTVEPEGYTDNVVFTSSDETVGSISEGILTIHKRGKITITASAAVSEVAPATMNVQYYNFVDYPRFPGDAEGQEREIMSDYNALSHTDGGWSVTTLTYVDNPSLSFVEGSQRNGYRYAMLDGRKIDKRQGGQANDLPTATNGTAFCWVRQTKNGTPDCAVYFIVDMQKSQVVDYFRTVNISGDKDDALICVTKFSEILGTNDISDDNGWVSLGKEVTGFNPVSHTESYPRESQRASINPELGSYRYIKFVMNDSSCYGVTKQGTTIQIDELYMGHKSYE